VAKKYKLEIIATADGFKDYTEVEVKLKPSTLDEIVPNPATENVTIGYKINQEGNAYLMILGSYGTNYDSNNYILDINNSQTTINLSSYVNGFYTVALVVNGQIVDAKTLIKQ
jgi:serine protease